ncbi:MAG TPA: amidohydrolase, partial [Megasphaera sp.]|nr:amidohydrolase [Megasphaera sp.]
MNQIQELAKKYQDTVVSLRREFHRHPELSFQEVETTTRIAAELDKLGIPYEINPEKNTGLVACLKGGKPGKA